METSVLNVFDQKNPGDIILRNYSQFCCVLPDVSINSPLQTPLILHAAVMPAVAASVVEE